MKKLSGVSVYYYITFLTMVENYFTKQINHIKVLQGLNNIILLCFYPKQDLGSITSRVIPKTLKMVLETSLLNTQQYKVRIKGKVEQSRERSSALPYTLV